MGALRDRADLSIKTDTKETTQDGYSVSHLPLQTDEEEPAPRVAPVHWK